MQHKFLPSYFFSTCDGNLWESLTLKYFLLSTNSSFQVNILLKYLCCLGLTAPVSTIGLSKAMR